MEILAMNALVALIALGGIGLIFYGPWQKWCEEYARQSVFKIRDEIFDLAADGQLSFDDPAYKHLRDSLNSVIRFAHGITIPSIIVMEIGAIKSEQKESTFSKAIQSLEDHDLRAKLFEKQSRVLDAVCFLAVMRSAPGLVLFVILAGWFILNHRALRPLRRKIGDFVIWKAELSQ